MFNLTLSERASVIFLTVISALLFMAVLVIGFAVTVSYRHHAPFYFAGKEYGIGRNELETKEAELANCRSGSADALRTMEGQLAQVQAENRQLKEANAALSGDEKARSTQARMTWLPISEISFYDDGKYSTDENREGKGKWSDPQSELTLKLVSRTDSGVILETNLATPYNKIRIPDLHFFVIRMSNYEYNVSVLANDDSHAEVRVDRRHKMSEAG